MMSVYMTEEEQLQAIKKWWQNYSTPILIVLSIVMLGISGYRYWHWHQEKILVQASTVYEHLMVSFAEHHNKETKSYANQLIKNYGQTVYADVARMVLAKIHVAKNQNDKAKNWLEEVVLKSKIPALKQIARMRVARLLIAEKHYDQALQKLSVIDDNAYMTVVNELKGDVFVEKGEYQQAIISYKTAINEAKTHGIGNLFLEMKTSELAALTESKNVLSFPGGVQKG